MQRWLQVALCVEVLAGSVGTAGAAPKKVRPAPGPLATAAQLLLVTSPSWDSPRGELLRLERPGPDQPFVRVGSPLPVWLGRHGLGWRSDEGAPEPPLPGPRKREGDGRSPAGIVKVGEMWGYAAAAPEGVRLTYHQAGPRDRCVDDADAKEYGRLVQAPASGPAPWRSAEEMRMPTDHYKYLAVLRYNFDHPRPGAGSCIFLHVAPAPEGPTAGCTALREDDLLTVLRWLDPAKGPLILQLPAPVLGAVQKQWQLPPELVPSAPAEKAAAR